MDFTCIFFGIMFTAAGLAFALGKGHIHLKAWKSMTQEEKEKINIVPLCRNVGEMIMLCGIIFLLKGLIRDFAGRWFVIAMVAWLIVAGFDVWHISKSERYRNKPSAQAVDIESFSRKER